MKNILNYEGIYAITRNGKLWSFPKKRVNHGGANHNGQFMKVAINHKGYFQVCLSKNREKITRPIHRLVAETFIPNPNNFPQVNHKNGIKTDNRVKNLEWVTNQQNTAHATKFGLKKKKLTKDIIKEIRSRYKTGEKQRVIALDFGVRQDLISRIVNFRIWKTVT